jgi:hypothetical protein
MMKMYGHSTPDAMRQNMMTFLSPYNLQDPPEILFKRCADCQEVAIIANVKYSSKQLLMNIIDLLTRCGLYQHNLEDWDRKPDANKTWPNLHPFIQEAYQHRLASGKMTAGQGGYAPCNCFAPFLANNARVNDILGNDTAETIATTINSHMTNLLAQTAASIEANATQINASLQQLATHNAQLHQQQQSLMQQMAILTTNASNATMRMCPCWPKSMPHPPSTVSSSNPTILLEVVDKAVDVVTVDVLVANAERSRHPNTPPPHLIRW